MTMDLPQPAQFAPILVAVYGSLRKGGKWHHLLAGADFLGAGWTVQAYTLYLTDYPCLEKTQALYQVRVEVYKVSASELQALDALEEHPEVYLREPAEVYLDQGPLLQAWIYFYPQAHALPQAVCLSQGDYLLSIAEWGADEGLSSRV